MHAAPREACSRQTRPGAGFVVSRPGRGAPGAISEPIRGPPNRPVGARRFAREASEDDVTRHARAPGSPGGGGCQLTSFEDCPMKQLIPHRPVAAIAAAPHSRRPARTPAAGRLQPPRRRGRPLAQAARRRPAGHAAALEDEDLQRRRQDQGRARRRSPRVHEAVPVGQEQARHGVLTSVGQRHACALRVSHAEFGSGQRCGARVGSAGGEAGAWSSPGARWPPRFSGSSSAGRRSCA